MAGVMWCSCFMAVQDSTETKSLLVG